MLSIFFFLISISQYFFVAFLKWDAYSTLFLNLFSSVLLFKKLSLNMDLLMHLLWSRCKALQYFKDRNMDELVPSFTEIRLGFSFEVIFLRELWSFISSSNHETNYRFAASNNFIFKSPSNNSNKCSQVPTNMCFLAFSIV